MNSGKICVSLFAETAEEFLRKIKSVAPKADMIELRFDCLDDVERRMLIDRLPAVSPAYLFTFRPREQGGRRDITLTERLKFWELALSTKRENLYIDIEFDPMLLPAVDPQNTQRIVSFHDFEGGSDVDALFESFCHFSDHLKIAINAYDITDTIDIWNLIDTAKVSNKKIIPIAMGEPGKWVRVLALAHGAFMTYASEAKGAETASGQISVDDLTNVYRAKELDEHTKIYGVIAGSTAHSMSPFIQNAAFKEVGINSVFVPLQVRNIEEFFRRMVMPETREINVNFHGFAVTNPHKQAIMAHLDEIDETARAIGAVNTVAIHDDTMVGCNTDAEGFMVPLRRRFGDLFNARVAIMGAGGAARACVYSLTKDGADVTVFARNAERANAVTSQLGGSGRTIDSNISFGDFDIIVNATPLGTAGPLQDETVAVADQLRGVKLVYDLVYNPEQTRLLKEAVESGAQTINGLEMLIEQGSMQFNIWTGRQPSADTMLKAAQDRLQG